MGFHGDLTNKDGDFSWNLTTKTGADSLDLSIFKQQIEGYNGNIIKYFLEYHGI
jgi:hypothetical protein